MTRLKVCCITSPAELELAVAYGADAIGLVGPMPSGPGCLTESEIARLAPLVPPGVDSFLLSSETRPIEVVEQVRRCRCSVIQLVDRVEDRVYAALRESHPTLRIVQVVHVCGPDAVTEALRLQEKVDALLLDSGNPLASTPTLGGTGKTHDWSLSAEIVNRVPLPVYLAGGLNPGNLADALRGVHPFGVDVCSGLRLDGHLNESLLAEFVDVLRG